MGPMDAGGYAASLSPRRDSLFIGGVAFWSLFRLSRGDGPLIAVKAILLVSERLIQQRKLWSVTTLRC
jgi:hypothetical protein